MHDSSNNKSKQMHWVTLPNDSLIGQDDHRLVLIELFQQHLKSHYSTVDQVNLLTKKTEDQDLMAFQLLQRVEKVRRRQ